MAVNLESKRAGKTRPEVGLARQVPARYPGTRACARGASLVRRLALTGFAWLALATSGCGGDVTTPDPGLDPTDDLAIANVIFATEGGTEVAYSHGNHWHGSLRVRRGELRPLRVWLVGRNQGSHDTPAEDEWFAIEEETEYVLQVTMEDPTIARWVGGGHQGALEGTHPGTTRASVAVYRRHREIFRAPPVPVVVSE